MAYALVSSQPTQQQLVDYANAVAVVNNYAYAITNQSLPVLDYPPDNYASFTTKFGPAKQHALNWSSNLFVEMLQLPQTIQQQAADLFNLEATMIGAYLDVLVADPSNADAKTGLGKSLTALQAVIGQQVTSIETIETGLTQFSTDIYSDAQILTGIAQDATADAGADQTQITKIQGDISTLQGQIATAQTLLTVSAIGIGLSIFVGCIGAVVCFIPGAQAIGIGMIVAAVGGTAASIAGTVIESEAIKSMQNQIDSDQQQITGLNQDIVLLNGVSTQFTNLYNANQAAQNALTTIKTMWTNLDSEIEAVKTDLADVANDATSAAYAQAQTDFGNAQTAWADVVAFAEALSGIDYKWQDAQGNWHSYTDNAPGLNASQVDQIPSNISAAA
jgi:hypothetical protein